jgi:hypothetical protein
MSVLFSLNICERFADNLLPLVQLPAQVRIAGSEVGLTVKNQRPNGEVAGNVPRDVCSNLDASVELMHSAPATIM